MTKEEQNLAIALAHGWKLETFETQPGEEIPSLGIYEGQNKVWVTPAGKYVRYGPPNYTDDRNTIISAVDAKIPLRMRPRFFRILLEESGNNARDYYLTIFATAEQWCLAFLRFKEENPL